MRDYQAYKIVYELDDFDSKMVQRTRGALPEIVTFKASSLIEASEVGAERIHRRVGYRPKSFKVRPAGY